MAAVAIACVVVLLLTLFLPRLNLKNFQLEEILTKWKMKRSNHADPNDTST